MTPNRHRSVQAELSPRRLVAAYASGAFPMPDPDAEQRIMWFCPDRRGLLPLDERFHVPRRLRRTLRQGRFVCTIDRAYLAVMRCCADRTEGTWITEDFLTAYGYLHELGLAHSIEVWPAASSAARQPVVEAEAAVPVGGLYGVALGGAFFAESMFHRARDGGSVALVCLVEHLRRQGFVLCDVQWRTPHLHRRFGACEVTRAEYLSLLCEALSRPVRFVGAD